MLPHIPSPWAAAVCALAPVGCFSSWNPGGGAKAPGYPGGGPGYYSPDDSGCWGGAGRQETGAFPPVWVQRVPPTTGQAVVGSARDRELGPSDSSLPNERSGTLGPLGRRSIALPAAGENFPQVGRDPLTGRTVGSLCSLNNKGLQPTQVVRASWRRLWHCCNFFEHFQATIAWTEDPGRLQSMESQSRTRLSDFTIACLQV